jgi:hypothetical protein
MQRKVEWNASGMECNAKWNGMQVECVAKQNALQNGMQYNAKRNALVAAQSQRSHSAIAA